VAIVLDQEGGHEVSGLPILLFHIEAIGTDDLAAKETQNGRSWMVKWGLITTRLCNSITWETPDLFNAVF